MGVTGLKRMKELKREDKRRDKEAKREERQREKVERARMKEAGTDPDLDGITPGPQPVPLDET